MTSEQIQKISALGYIVVNMGQYVEDMNKNVVVSKDVDGHWVTEVAEIKTLLVPTETVKVRARNNKGHYIKDDPDTPENVAWPTKLVTQVQGNK